MHFITLNIVSYVNLRRKKKEETTNLELTCLSKCLVMNITWTLTIIIASIPTLLLSIVMATCLKFNPTNGWMDGPTKRGFPSGLKGINFLRGPIRLNEIALKISL